VLELIHPTVYLRFLLGNIGIGSQDSVTPPNEWSLLCCGDVGIDPILLCLPNRGIRALANIATTTKRQKIFFDQHDRAFMVEGRPLKPLRVCALGIPIIWGFALDEKQTPRGGVEPGRPRGMLTRAWEEVL